MVSAGIDVGSRTVKVVLLDQNSSQLLARAVSDQEVRQEDLALELLDRLLQEQGLRRTDLSAIVSTGYGRNSVAVATRAITEITCQARGVLTYHPEARTVIEIGGAGQQAHPN